MTDFVWHWKTESNNRVYTKNVSVAEKAMKDGFLVLGIRKKPHIFRG